MIELCYFSLDQWDIKIHLLWGKCFNIPHWPKSHSTNRRLQHIEDLFWGPSFRPNQTYWLIALDNWWCPWGVQNVLPKNQKYEIQRKEIISLIEERNTFAPNEKSDSVVNTQPRTRANQENEEEFCCQEREQEKGGGEQWLAYRGISFRDGTGFKSNPEILWFFGTGLARYFTHI